MITVNFGHESACECHMDFGSIHQNTTTNILKSFRVLFPLTFQLPAMMGCRIFNLVAVLLLVLGALLLLMVLKAFALPQRAAVAKRATLTVDSFIVGCWKWNCSAGLPNRRHQTFFVVGRRGRNHSHVEAIHWWWRGG